MNQRRSCDQQTLYACIKALLIVYHAGKFEHTSAAREYTSKKRAGSDIYNMFHSDATVSVNLFARKLKRSQGYVVNLLTAGLRADLDPNHTKEVAASPRNPHQIRRAEDYLHRLGECLHNDKDTGKDIGEDIGKHVGKDIARCAEDQDQYW